MKLYIFWHYAIKETFRQKNHLSIWILSKGYISMDEKLHGREPPEIPSVWSLWVSNGTWGSNHMLNRLFGSLVLASGGQSSDPAWPADKRRALTTIEMGEILFSSNGKSGLEWGLAGWIGFHIDFESEGPAGSGFSGVWRGLWEMASAVPAQPADCPLTQDAP